MNIYIYQADDTLFKMIPYKLNNFATYCKKILILKNEFFGCLKEK